MSEQPTSNEQVSLAETISELRLSLGNVEAGPWEVYTSNSLRRIGLAGEYRELVYPRLCADGAIDIVGYKRLSALVSAFNAAPQLLDEIERLQQRLKNYEPVSLYNGLTIDQWKARAEAAEARLAPEPLHALTGERNLVVKEGYKGARPWNRATIETEDGHWVFATLNRDMPNWREIAELMISRATQPPCTTTEQSLAIQCVYRAGCLDRHVCDEAGLCSPGGVTSTKDGVR